MSWVKKAKPVERSAPAGGYAIVNGVRLHLHDVVLRRAEIEFRFRCVGPCELEGPITVFGVDHQGVMQGGMVTPRSVLPGEHAEISYKLRVQSVTEPDNPFVWSEGPPRG